MASSKQLRTGIEAAKFALAQSTKLYNNVRSQLAKIEDQMISDKETLRKLTDALDEVMRAENTVLEEDYRDREIAMFRDRLPGVLDKLEKAGSATIKDPITEWVQRNKNLLHKYDGQYIAVSGGEVVINHESKDSFSIKLANLDSKIRSTAMIFYVSDYIKSDGPLEWFKNNCSELTKYVGEHVAIHATRGIVAHDKDLQKVKIKVDVLELYGKVLYKLIDKSIFKDIVNDWISKNRSRLQKSCSWKEITTLCLKECFKNDNPSHDEYSFVESHFTGVPHQD